MHCLHSGALLMQCGALLTQCDFAYAQRVADAQCVADALGAWLMHLRVADAALG